MAHYNLHLSEIPLEFGISTELEAVSTQKVDLHAFGTELEVISNYADKHGSTPRVVIQEEGAQAGGEEESNKQLINNNQGRKQEDDSGVQAQFAMSDNNDNDDTNNKTEAESSASADLPSAQGEQGISPSDAAAASVERVEIVNNNEHNNDGAGGGDSIVKTDDVENPSSDPVTVVSGIEINTDHEQTILLDGAPATVIPVIESATDIGNDGTVQVFSTASAEGEAAMAMAVAEQVHEDADVALLVDQDNKVTELVSKCNISRDECRFYLESTDWNVQEAVNIYNSFN
jgi:hypothetical protein